MFYDAVILVLALIFLLPFTIILITIFKTFWKR